MPFHKSSSGKGDAGKKIASKSGKGKGDKLDAQVRRALETHTVTAKGWQCLDCDNLASNGDAIYHRHQTGHKVVGKKERARLLGGKVETTDNGTQGAAPSEAHVAFICGRFQAEIESYASSIGVPQSAIAARVAEFLRLSSRRGVLGSGNRLSGSGL